MNLSENPLDPSGINQYEQNYIAQQIAPQTAQLTSSLGNSGQAYGSYAGGMVGQQMAEGQLQALQAGLDYAQQYFNNQLQGRSNIAQTAIQPVQQQNELAINRGLGLVGAENQSASISSQNAGNQNQFSLGASGSQNQLNLGNYQQASANWALPYQIMGSAIGGLGSGFGAGAAKAFLT